LTQSFRIVHIEPLPDWIRRLYESVLQDPEYDLAWGSELPDEELGPLSEGASVIVTGKRRVNDRLIRAAGPTLRLIQVAGRAPWAVETESALAAGIRVSFMPHRGAIAVAEHTFALLMGLMRKLVPGHLGAVDAEYQQLEIEPIRTSERVIAFNWLGFTDVRQLFGKTMGLIGLGDIGLEVARRACGFDMEVLYTKRQRLPLEYEKSIGVRYAPLPELLELSDVVSLHAPQTDETTGLIGSEAFSLMKASAVLVNTARGGLVDEQALVEALRSGRIAGAGLDVFVDEPLPVGHGLANLDNVLLSPHVGGGTGGGQKGLVADIQANIDRVRSGESPRHLVSS
jgi:phosphoglycerate dehydrogenase-like enzyme